MANPIKGVSIKVHPLFFESIFEKERKNAERRLKTTLSQVKFTEYLAKNGIDMKLKRDNFVPRQFRKKFYV